MDPRLSAFWLLVVIALIVACVNAATGKAPLALSVILICIALLVR